MDGKTFEATRGQKINHLKRGGELAEKAVNSAGASALVVAMRLGGTDGGGTAEQG